ncbi:hypothetical protein LUZ60_000816 [Juncus effusus]|nr:hypothetical protein LUZ60_000816 [Juncus effusus]
MEWNDDWLAADKLQHFLACFLITLIVAALAGRSRHAFLRRRSAALGTIASIAAGAAKEAGDEIGIWRSAGGSVKDAAADLAGIVIALILIRLVKRFGSLRSESQGEKGIGMV